MSTLPKFTCRFCGSTFAKDRKDGRFDARSTSIAIIDKEGRFCTLRCAARYGVSAARAADLKRNADDIAASITLPRRKP